MAEYSFRPGTPDGDEEEHRKEFELPEEEEEEKIEREEDAEDGGRENHEHGVVEARLLRHAEGDEY